jgi:hypothetical protein
MADEIRYMICRAAERDGALSSSANSRPFVPLQFGVLQIVALPIAGS